MVIKNRSLHFLFWTLHHVSILPNHCAVGASSCGWSERNLVTDVWFIVNIVLEEVKIKKSLEYSRSKGTERPKEGGRRGWFWYWMDFLDGLWEPDLYPHTRLTKYMWCMLYICKGPEWRKAAGAVWACPSEGKRQYTLKSYERGKGKRRT